MGCRKKKFIGAAIGAVTSIAGGLIQGAIQKKYQDEEYARQYKFQREAAARTTASNLTNAYGDQDYVNDYKKKVTLKMGGKAKVTYKDRYDNLSTDSKNSKYTDRRFKYKCGGKK